MAALRRLYRRTGSGEKALASARSVPGSFRGILGLIGSEAQAAAICGAMPGHTEKQVLEWLEQLETLGLIERVGDGAMDMRTPAVADQAT
jgi:hypothetical protein